MKALSWHVPGTFDTILITDLVTGQAKWAFSVGFVELFTKGFLYIVHKRVWNRLALGRIHGSESFSI